MAASFRIDGREFPLNGKKAVSMATIWAQLLMIPIALISGSMTKVSWVGYKQTLVVAYFTCTLRAAIFAFTDDVWTMLAVRCALYDLTDPTGVLFTRE